MEKEVKLPKALQEKVDALGNTPMDEPEVAKIIDDINEKKTSVLELSLHFISEDELDGYSDEVLVEFHKRVMKKVTDFLDEDGYYKHIEKLNDWQPVKPSTALKVKKLQKALNEKREKTIKKLQKTNADKLSADELKDLTKKIEKVNEESLSIILDHSGIDKEVIDALEKWEKDLLVSMTADSVARFDNSALGKRFKNS